MTGTGTAWKEVENAVFSFHTLPIYVTFSCSLSLVALCYSIIMLSLVTSIPLDCSNNFHLFLAFSVCHFSGGISLQNGLIKTQVLSWCYDSFICSWWCWNWSFKGSNLCVKAALPVWKHCVFCLVPRREREGGKFFRLLKPVSGENVHCSKVNTLASLLICLYPVLPNSKAPFPLLWNLKDFIFYPFPTKAANKLCAQELCMTEDLRGFQTKQVLHSSSLLCFHMQTPF